jgi:ribonuclease E
MDRARIQLGRLSRFGLLELSRQRLRPALSETTHINCPRCGGMGNIRGVESMSLALLRLIGEEARKERTGRVIAQVPVDVATYLINEKRDWLNQIESRDKVSLVVVPNPHLQTPAYILRRIRDDEKELPENNTASYQIAEQPTIDDSNIGNRDKKPQGDVPLVPSILPASAAPVAPIPVPAPAPVAPQVGALVRFWRWLFGSGGEAKETAPSSSHTQRHRPAHRDARHDRYRTSGERERSRDRGDRDRGDRDRNREARRDGGRDPRRDGRSRGENRSDSAPRRTDAPERAAGGPRPEGAPASRPDSGPRSEQPGRNEPMRGNEPRTGEASGGERPSGERDRGERDRGERDRGDRERGGRNRRRRGRGRREGGDSAGMAGNVGNGSTGAASGPGGGTSQAASGGESASAASFEPPHEPARHEPARHEPAREPAREAAAPPPTAAGSENKYVVWSSTPSDVSRSGPDDR